MPQASNSRIVMTLETRDRVRVPSDATSRVRKVSKPKLTTIRKYAT